MSGSKPFEFGQTVLIFLALIGVCVWIGMILNAKGEAKLEQSCKPVEITTQFVHEATFALVGRQTTWTLYVQRYLMSGCYYFFSVIYSQHSGGLLGGGGESATTSLEDAPPVGGIHN
jgi:hypothetical protein